MKRYAPKTQQLIVKASVSTIAELENSKSNFQNMVSSTSNLHPKQCRICLENQNDSSQKIISPCNCTGSVKYVHVQCLQSWIKKSTESHRKNYQLGENSIQCQMCKTDIIFNLNITKKCNSCYDICLEIKQKKCLALLISFMLCITLIAISVLLWVIIQGKMNFTMSTLLQSTLFVCSIVVIVLFSIISAYFIVEQYILGYRVIISISQVPLRKNKSLTGAQVIPVTVQSIQ